MVASIPWLVLWWGRRLERLRGRGAGAGDGWMTDIRVRILTFLVSRYSGVERAAEPERPDPEFDFSFWLKPPPPPEPADHPIREPVVTAAILRDIARCNRQGRPRWRWWL